MWVGVDRQRQVYALGLPLIAGQFSQGLTSLIDTALVAGLDDPVALAAVGISGYASFLACAFVLGFSVGVQTLVARRVGEGRPDRVFAALNAGVLLSVAVGLVLSVFFYFFAPALMAAFNGDAQVQAIAVEYFRYRCLGIAALGLSFACRGYWNGINRSMVYLAVLLCVQFSNILFSYGLIYGRLGLPQMGAPGSGLGTMIATYIGALLSVFLTYGRNWHQLRSLPDRQVLRSIAQLGVPNSTQQFFVAMAMSLFYWILGRMGVDELAVGHVLVNITLFVILPANGFGMAATTLVSQALGRGQADDAHSWGWDSLKTALPLLLLLAAPLWLAQPAIIEWFIPNRPDLAELARVPLNLIGIVAVLQGLAVILSQALLGAGDNRRVMWSFSILQWGFMLPAVAVAGLAFKSSINLVWLILLVHWLLHLLLFSWLWQRKHWRRIRI